MVCIISVHKILIIDRKDYKMKKIITFFSIKFILVLFILQGCQINEKRIREIVREEFSSAMKRTTISDAYTIGPYSPAQRIGNFLFVSGQIAIDQETGLLENKDFETEVHLTLENLLTVLNNAGFTADDVISTTVYLTNIADFGKMNDIYHTYFKEGNYPARATVQVSALPGGAKIEISAIAYKSS